MTRASPAWWPAGGLPFRCTGCADCCRRPGFVSVAAERALQIVEHLHGPGADPVEWIGRYWIRDGESYRIEVTAERACPFLDGDLCSVHPVKPEQCATYPFWDENLTSRYAWRYEAKYCEGIGASDTVVAVPDIIAMLERDRAAREG